MFAEQMFAGELLVKIFNERMFAELAYANHSLHSPLPSGYPTIIIPHLAAEVNRHFAQT